MKSRQIVVNSSKSNIKIQNSNYNQKVIEFKVSKMGNSNAGIQI